MMLWGMRPLKVGHSCLRQQLWLLLGTLYFRPAFVRSVPVLLSPPGIYTCLLPCSDLDTSASPDRPLLRMGTYAGRTRMHDGPVNTVFPWQYRTVVA